MKGVGITNTCIQEFYENQKNYNTFKLARKDKISFVIENRNPTFALCKEP